MPQFRQEPIESIKVRSVGELIDRGLRNPSAQRRIVAWYRGQSQEDWRLLPRVWRPELSKRADISAAQLETVLALQFRRQAGVRTVGAPYSDDFVAWLVLAQHHGLATRLLDWSGSICVAAYFASQLPDNVDGVVWWLDPNAMNESVHRNKALLTPGDGFCELACQLAFVHSDVQGLPEHVRACAQRFQDAAVAMDPLETHLRMLIQQSKFTIHGADVSLDTLPAAHTFLRRFVIPAERKQEFRQSLALMGVREDTVFPDLDHLARALNNYR